jgi:hypothetical protein
MYKFKRLVVGKFGRHYLRGPNKDEIAHIMAQNEAIAFSEKCS